MAQCKPQERIIASASALATGRLYRLAGKIDIAQTYERRGEKILLLMVAEAPEEDSDFLGKFPDYLLTTWELCEEYSNPILLDEWGQTLVDIMDRELAAIRQEISKES